MFSPILDSKPSKIDIAIISTVTPNPIPPIVISDISERNFDPLLFFMYLPAIKRGNFIQIVY